MIIELWMFEVSGLSIASRTLMGNPKREKVLVSSAEFPMTSGVHSSRIAGDATAFATTSGPIPHGSPMVIATVGGFVKGVGS